MGDRVLIDRNGPVAVLTLNRLPENLVDAAMVAELQAACEAVGEDSSVSVVIVTGEGANFSSGWDGALRTVGNVDEVRAAGILEDPFRCLAELRQPGVAAINGEAFGAGLALALAADVRVCDNGARFRVADVGDGETPMAGVLSRLVRAVGRGHAMRMALMGEQVTAEEALSIGLVSEITPEGEVVRRACEIASQIAERGPLAVQYAKEVVNRGRDMPLEQALRYETDLTVILQTTEDRAEGVRAFQEKRKPEFKGK
jgi:enoyl-CoA hydratase/carnithine racemase